MPGGEQTHPEANTHPYQAPLPVQQSRGEQTQPVVPSVEQKQVPGGRQQIPLPPPFDLRQFIEHPPKGWEYDLEMIRRMLGGSYGVDRPILDKYTLEAPGEEILRNLVRLKLDLPIPKEPVQPGMPLTPKGPVETGINVPLLTAMVQEMTPFGIERGFLNPPPGQQMYGTYGADLNRPLGQGRRNPWLDILFR